MKNLFTIIILLLFINKSYSYCVVDPPLFINSNTNWNTNNAVFSDIVISTGATLDINNCTIKFRQGCSITVENGACLIVNNSTLTYTCQGMWRGIYEKNGGKVIIRDSYVTDAEIALNLEPGVDLSITNSHFDRNYYGLYTAPSTSTTTFVNFYLDNVVFECTSSLVFNSMPYPATRTMAGIFFNNTISTIEGAANPLFFNDLINGIILSNSFTTVQKSRFSMIYPDNNLFNSFDGSGIYASGGLGHILSVTGLGQTNVYTFSQCTYGVNTQDIDVNINNCRMELMNYGIICYKSVNHGLKIEFNTIQADAIGIQLKFCDLAIYNVNHNDIYMNNFGSTIGGTGIEIHEGGIGGASGRVFAVNYIELYNSKYGILASACKDIDFNYNEVRIKDLAPDYGIGVLGGKNLYFKCNTVEDLYVDQDPFKYMFYNSVSTGNTYLTNKAKNGSIGWKFDGNCLTTNFTGNEMNNNRYRRLWIGTNSVIGPQYAANNLFTAPSSRIAECDPATVVLNQFHTSTTWTRIPSVIIPASGWFFPILQGDIEFACEGQLPPRDKFDPIEIKMANGETELPIYTVENIDISKATLIEKAIECESTLPENLQEFLISNSNSSIYYLKNEENILSNLLKIDDAQFQSVNNWSLNTLDFLNQMQQNTIIYNSSNDLNLKNQARNNNILLSNQLQYLINNNLPAYQSIIHNNLAVLEQAKQNITALNLQSEVFDNEKVVMKYVYDLHKGGWEPSIDDLSIIEEIANKCPLSNGQAVFIARNLFKLFYKNAQFSDFYSCELESSSFRWANPELETDRIELYPNPTNEYVNVNYNFDESDDIEITCYNTLGQTMFKSDLTVDANQISLNVSSLPVGLYTIYFKTSSGEIKQSKFLKN